MKQKSILVTGINGFVGHHLAVALHEAQHKVIGVDIHSEATEANQRLLTTYIRCDLTEEQDVQAIPIAGVDAVIHLAALANVSLSFQQPALFIANNSKMVVHLLQHALNSASQATFLLVSSASVYNSNQPLPIAEDGQIIHNSPYVISKLTSEHICDYYSSRGLKCIVARPFNIVGPGQGQGYLLPDLAAQLQHAGKSGGVVLTGNLNTRRDYIDVRDVARAYLALVAGPREPAFSIYNICSGRSYSGQEILNELIKAFDFMTLPIISTDRSRIRPNEVLDMRGSNQRLQEEFSWQPTIGLSQTIEDFVAWLKRLV